MSIQQYSEPIVIISDVHVKNSNGWKEQINGLRGLWATAGTVVFNGDTVGTRETNNGTSAEEILKYISEQCAKDGAEAVFLAGNSDYFINTTKHLLLAGGRTPVRERPGAAGGGYETPAAGDGRRARSDVRCIASLAGRGRSGTSRKGNTAAARPLLRASGLTKVRRLPAMRGNAPDRGASAARRSAHQPHA